VFGSGIRRFDGEAVGGRRLATQAVRDRPESTEERKPPAFSWQRGAASRGEDGTNCAAEGLFPCGQAWGRLIGSKSRRNWIRKVAIFRAAAPRADSSTIRAIFATASPTFV
jgi:hypothetical protein